MKDQKMDPDTGEIIYDEDLTVDELEEEANEALTDEFDAAPRMVSEAAWNVGNKLLKHFHDELTAAGVRQSNDTKFALSRFERRIKSEILAGYAEILAGSAPAARAQLKKITIEGDKILGALVFDKNIEHHHELADFARANSDVLVVLADDIGEHLAGMDETILHLSEMQHELPLDMPASSTPEEVEQHAKDLQDLAELATATDDIPPELVNQVDDQIAAADAELEEATAEAQKLDDVDPARHIVKGGKMIGIAPDPDCITCKGNGGWDMNVPDPEGGEEPVQEWVRCDCVEYQE